MQRIFPDHRAMDLSDLHAGLTLDAGEERAWLAIDMVTSLDGAATVDGRTDRLGGEADAVIFRQLRAAADAILIGAGTVRAEGYGPGGGSAQRRADRESRGLAPRPRMVIVTGSLDLAPGHRVFSDPSHPPVVVTHGQASEERGRALQDVAEVVRIGDDEVDLPALLHWLAAQGLRRVLCEGGPQLNGSLLDADLIDEVFLTVAPSAFAGGAPRIAGSPREIPDRDFTLRSVHEHDHELLLRYQRAR